MTMQLSGKVALVTGGVGLLGRHFCEALAAAGAHVVVSDLDANACEDFSRQLEAGHGQRSIGIGCDVTDPASVDRMIETIMQMFGRLDVAHSNAATKTDDLSAFFAPLESYSLATWRQIMAVNLDGMFLVSRAAGCAMEKAERGGSIILTSSIYGVVAPDPRIYTGSRYLDREINTPAAYSASKAGVIGLGKHLATHWAPKGIRVNVLTPGGVDTGQNETFRARYADRVPLGRMAQADEMVGALVFLASDASSYVTGQNIVVDGGLTAW
jgi:NAD(P)-dependent dehydrogenase (short-subunit alcohol dehydrogenase family)